MMTRMILMCGAILLMTVHGFGQISAGGTPPSQSLAITATAPTVTMPSFDVDDYLAEDAQAPKDVAYRFGVPFEVGYDLNSSGTWTELPDGGALWRLRISSPDAYSINLIYDQFHMPEGGRLFVYNDGYRYVIGAFTSFNNKSHGMFSTQPVPGDAITLEYYEPANVRGQGVISIMRVVHAYRNLFGYSGSLDSFGDSGSCNNNVACDDQWNNEERGVVMLVTSGGSRFCTGSMINNVNNDGAPYLLTAYHCSISSTSIAMFNYQSPTCTPNQDGPTNQTVSGGTEVWDNSSSDGSLFLLSTNVPETFNTYFNGWSAVDSPADSVIGIHHPRGDVKKISWEWQATSSTDYLGTSVPGDGTHWRVTDWDDGTTEPGSSGSPIFDGDRRIVGQLHGGYAACGNDESDWYGKVALSMTLGMRAHLDPGNTGVMVLDGYDPAVAGRVVGVVIDTDTEDPVSGVLVAVQGGGPTTSTNALGEYNLPLPDGTYSLDYSKWGYETHMETGVTITEGDTVTRDVHLDPLTIVTVLSEGFESGAPGWSHRNETGWGDDWHISHESAHTGSASYKCGDTGTGDYSNSLDARLLSPVLFDLPADAQLSFWMRIESETSGAYPDSAYDGGVLDIDVNSTGFVQLTPSPGYTKTFRYTSGGGTPVTGPMPGLVCWAGGAPTWTEYTADLAAYEGQDIQLRFRFGSDGGATDEGWYVDDVQILAIGSPVVQPTALTISVVGSDVVLRWAEDSNPYYQIYSSDLPYGTFTVIEGTTSLNEWTIVGGAAAEIKFYYVVGTASP